MVISRIILETAMEITLIAHGGDQAVLTNEKVQESEAVHAGKNDSTGQHELVQQQMSAFLLNGWMIDEVLIGLDISLI